jgi:REP element-mobilizing transposase RayT
MSRPLRIEFPGAVYHLTSRGDRREAIYLDDADRQTQIDVIGQAMDRFDAVVLAYCLMGNHYHLVVHTREPNLSRLMRHVNGVYTQAFNRRHGMVGHLFQGRFKAILVDGDAYLLRLCRYVERNPVAAGLVANAGDWVWSSYRAHVGEADAPAWLDTDGLLAYLIETPMADAQDRQLATLAYAALVNDADCDDAQFWQGSLRQQVYLGDDDFVSRMQARSAAPQRLAVDVPKAQRLSALTLQDCLHRCADQATALHMAYRDGGITMTAIAQELGLSVSRVSRLIASVEREKAKGKT